MHGLDFSGGQFISDVVCSYFFRVKLKNGRAKMMFCKRMVLSIMVSFWCPCQFSRVYFTLSSV